MNNNYSRFKFMDTTLPMSTRAIYFFLFSMGCIWIGMGLFTILTVLQMFQSVAFSYFSLATFLTVVLVYMQIVIGVGLLRLRKWVLSILGIHIVVTLFTLLVVLPQVGLQTFILPSLYGLMLTFLPLFILTYIWRGYLIGSANIIWINALYFLAVSSVAAINTFLQVLQT